MGKVIKALDFTHRYADESVLNKMVDVSERGDTIDFTDVFVMDSDIGLLANIILNNDLEVDGLEDESSLLLESYIRKLQIPEFSNLVEFSEMFKAKFPIGTLCIWDRTLEDDLKTTDTRVSLIMIENVYKNFVRFRQYKSHTLEPLYVYENGGLDSLDLYTLETLHLSDLANKTVMFRYPKDDVEEVIIDLLLEIDAKIKEEKK